MATEAISLPKAEPSSKKSSSVAPSKNVQITTIPFPISLTCTAEGCNAAFRAPTKKLVRKALMRHLYRYQKSGIKVPADASDLTAKQVLDKAHYLAYETEVLSYKTSAEKQAESRARYKAANKEKVARASRISNYRAQAKKISEVMEQGMEAVYKWAEEKELKREEKVSMGAST